MMMMGEAGRTSRPPIIQAPTVVVVADVGVIAATVILVVTVGPSRSWVDGLHRDLGSGLSCGVEGLSSGVVLRPELHCGLHSDLGLLSKTMATVGRRGTAVAWGRHVI